MTDKDFIFGIRAVIEAINSGKSIERLVIKKGLKGELFGELFSLVRKNEIPFQYVPIERINRITRKNHQGVIAFISPVTYTDLDGIVPTLFENGKTPLILILDQITDVRNFGAIARTAECAGINAIVIPQKGAAQINSDAVKTSAGALLTIPVCRVNKLSEAVTYLKNSGLQIVSASEKFKTSSDSKEKTVAFADYYNVDLTLPTAIIMGSEDKGIAKECLKLSDYIARIPVYGNIASLNVSVACAVIIYEAIRQRNI